MTTTLQSLEQSKAEALAEYHRLLTRAANNEDIDYDHLRDVLADCGKTRENFAAAVAVKQQRYADDAGLKRADAAEPKQVELDNARAELLSKREAMLKRHEQELKELDAELLDATVAASNHSHQVTELRRACKKRLEKTASQATKQRVAQIDATLSQLSDESGRLNRELMQTPRHMLEQAAELRRPRLDEIEAEQKTLQAERTELIASYLDPDNAQL